MKRLQALSILALAFPLLSSASTCEKPDLALVRTDERSHRLFIVATPRELRSARSFGPLLMKTATFLRACRPDWREDWSLSFFIDRDAADYKTETADPARAVRGYVGEYNRKDGRMTLYPADPQRIVRGIL